MPHPVLMGALKVAPGLVSLLRKQQLEVWQPEGSQPPTRIYPSLLLRLIITGVSAPLLIMFVASGGFPYDFGSYPGLLAVGIVVGLIGLRNIFLGTGTSIVRTGEGVSLVLIAAFIAFSFPFFFVANVPGNFVDKHFPIIGVCTVPGWDRVEEIRENSPVISLPSLTEVKEKAESLVGVKPTPTPVPTATPEPAKFLDDPGEWLEEHSPFGK